MEQGFPGGLAVKNLLPMQEMWVRSLGWEDPLKQEMTTYSSILTWRFPWTEDLGGLQSTGSQKSQTQLKRLSRHACPCLGSSWLSHYLAPVGGPVKVLYLGLVFSANKNA